MARRKPAHAEMSNGLLAPIFIPAVMHCFYCNTMVLTTLDKRWELSKLYVMEIIIAGLYSLFSEVR